MAKADDPAQRVTAVAAIAEEARDIQGLLNVAQQRLRPFASDDGIQMDQQEAQLIYGLLRASVAQMDKVANGADIIREELREIEAPQLREVCSNE